MVADARSRFEEHLMTALDEVESGEAAYHIREGLQLVQCERDDAESVTAISRRRREGRTDGSRGACRRSLARMFDSSPLDGED